MTTITILPENPGSPLASFRAIAGNKQSSGKTAGAVLDALATQLDPAEAPILIVLHHAHPDRFFTAEQQTRLLDLMTRWRQARDAGQAFSAEEQIELNALVTAELRAATARAQAMLEGFAS